MAANHHSAPADGWRSRIRLQLTTIVRIPQLIRRGATLLDKCFLGNSLRIVGLGSRSLDDPADETLACLLTHQLIASDVLDLPEYLANRIHLGDLKEH